MASVDDDSTEAEILFKKALANAKEAEFEAGLAYPFLNNRFSEQQREAAQAAQDAAHEASKQAVIAEQIFYSGDVTALMKVCQALLESFEKARDAAQYAMTDDTMLGYCPACMTRANRLSVKPERAEPLEDGTQCWTKRFQCFMCTTYWREIYTTEGVLVHRIIEASD